MKNSPLHFLLAFVVLTAGCALEELLPKPCGIGFPVLLAAVLGMGVRRSLGGAMLFAVAAGAAEDALSGLPMLASGSYFLAAAALAHGMKMRSNMMLLLYPLYQFWLALWLFDVQDNVFVRVLLAAPVGWMTAFAVEIAYTWIERKAALNEAG